MNPFSVFDLEVSFFPDLTAIRQDYYRLSRLYHPDLQEDKEKEEEALIQSSLLNAAYKTLNQFESRVASILRLQNKINEE
ncbi:MAG: J domain-containing protein [Bacteroidota bacterium]|nr:J domain-containing protein [Bacteroidota bacterium]MDX5430371.1 J domain-containing protein [Bacteroidota bacterium]MDX5469132.1 J domain-containing protein [Bacteroidota bacterium]